MVVRTHSACSEKVNGVSVFTDQKNSGHLKIEQIGVCMYVSA